MNKFPVGLKPTNASKFESLDNVLVAGQLRQAIYKHLVSKKSDGFDLVEFAHHNNLGTTPEQVKSKIKKELEDLGWQVELQYGGTLMYIYTKTLNKQPLKFVRNIE